MTTIPNKRNDPKVKLAHKVYLSVCTGVTTLSEPNGKYNAWNEISCNQSQFKSWSICNHTQGLSSPLPFPITHAATTENNLLDSKISAPIQEKVNHNCFSKITNKTKHLYFVTWSLVFELTPSSRQLDNWGGYQLQNNQMYPSPPCKICIKLKCIVPSGISIK